MVKNMPAMQESWVQSLGLEDPLKKEMVTHSSILTWKIPWMENPGPRGCKESDTTKQLDMTERLRFLSFTFFLALKPPTLQKVSAKYFERHGEGGGLQDKQSTRAQFSDWLK